MNTITLTDEQYQALQNGKSITIEPPKTEAIKWEPKGGPFTVAGDGTTHMSNSSDPWKNYGVEYHTREAAEKANKAMRTHNRLLAWIAENDDGWKPDWNDDSQKKFYLRKDHNKALEPNSRYYVGSSNSLQSVAVSYMSEQNANKLCKLLNNGIVIL